jgi:HEAT repeat protein
LLRDKSKDVRHAAALYITEKPDKKSVENLINILEGPDSYIAFCAAGALGAIRDERAVEPLIKILSKTHTNNSVHASSTQPTVKTARMLAGTSGGIKVVPADESSLKVSAAMALGKIGDKKAVPALIECLSNKENDQYLRKEAAIALKHIGDPAALAAIEGLPEGWFVEVGNARKASVPLAPPGGKMPRNIPGYPTTE